MLAFLAVLAYLILSQLTTSGGTGRQPPSIPYLALWMLGAVVARNLGFESFNDKTNTAFFNFISSKPWTREPSAKDDGVL